MFIRTRNTNHFFNKTYEGKRKHSITYNIHQIDAKLSIKIIKKGKI